MLQMVDLPLVLEFLQSDFIAMVRAVLQVQASPASFSGTTAPYPQSSSLHFGFATREASVLGVLADFSFLHHLPEGGSIMGPYLPTILTLVLLALSPQTRSEPREWVFIFLIGNKLYWLLAPEEEVQDKVICDQRGLALRSVLYTFGTNLQLSWFLIKQKSLPLVTLLLCPTPKFKGITLDTKTLWPNEGGVFVWG